MTIVYLMKQHPSKNLLRKMLDKKILQLINSWRKMHLLRVRCPLTDDFQKNMTIILLVCSLNNSAPSENWVIIDSRCIVLRIKRIIFLASAGRHICYGAIYSGKNQQENIWLWQMKMKYAAVVLIVKILNCIFPFALKLKISLSMI